MKKIQIHTVCKKMLADVYTPVGIYLRLRDRFRDTVLLESTDHHATDNSWSFIGVQAIGGIEVKDMQTLEYKYPGQPPVKEAITDTKGIATSISTYLQRYETGGDKTIPAAHSLFGYTSYDAVKFFEDLTPTSPPAPLHASGVERGASIKLSSQNAMAGLKDANFQNNPSNSGSSNPLPESNLQESGSIEQHSVSILQGINSREHLSENSAEILTEAPLYTQSVERGGGEVQEPYIKYSVSAPKQYELARQLRHAQTEAESILWEALRTNKEGEKFRRQHPINAYIVDFVCLQKALIVEVDGEYHNDAAQKLYDDERTKVFTYIGFRLIRFTNEEVLTNLKSVLKYIKNALAAPLTSPPSPLQPGRLERGASVQQSSKNVTAASKESNFQNSSVSSGSSNPTYKSNEQSTSSTNPPPASTLQSSNRREPQPDNSAKIFTEAPLSTPWRGEGPGVRYRLYQYVIAINHFKDELYICENQVAGLESEMAVVESLIRSRNVPEYPFAAKGEEASNLTNEEYMQMVEKGKAACQRGDVFQIVLSRRFQQGFTGDEFNVYRALRSVNPSPYLFYFDYGDYRLFGSSPESQLVIQNGKAIVHPIAGTFKRTGNDAQDEALAEKLLLDPKENAEHVMLVDLARNDLSRHAQNVTVSSYRKVHYYSHVIHLVSEVTGQIAKNTAPYDVFAATFPAGTLSGAPKVKAMQLINQWEPTPRGYYGGAIGLLGLDGSFNHAIMIRTFLSRNNTLHYQAGAGITVNSIPENELQEVTNKLGALKKAIVLAEEISR